MTDVKGFSVLYSCESVPVSSCGLLYDHLCPEIRNWMEIIIINHSVCFLYFAFFELFFEFFSPCLFTYIASHNLFFVSSSCCNLKHNEEMLLKLLQADLPNSIFSRLVGINNLQILRSLSSNIYSRLIHIFVSSVTRIWQHGELTNFEYLMHINAAAGRSFQDLTQYPVFPWIIADYSSEVLDFNDPATFRDLSQPMGALGARREGQYRERYQTMDEFYREGIEGAAPPFFYGTHYSCAG